MTAMYYIQKQGGTHSHQLSLLAQQIWHWAIHNQIHLMPEYLPGVENHLADRLSQSNLLSQVGRTTNRLVCNKGEYEMPTLRLQKPSPTLRLQKPSPTL